MYEWAVIGAGPAGLTSVGLLLDAGIAADQILLFDPRFRVGDFGQCWGEVYSNTTVSCFLKFLNGIKAFSYSQDNQDYVLNHLPKHEFCQLKEVAKPLQAICERLRQQVESVAVVVDHLQIVGGAWQISANGQDYRASKVILATGAVPRVLAYESLETLELVDALNPALLQKNVGAEDQVAVFGSSHSAMIIIKNLLDCGVKKVVNFYLSGIKFAKPMGEWTLYDNTGLKGVTAQWTKENILHKQHPKIERYLSHEGNTERYLASCNKAVYAVGFNKRELAVVGDVQLSHYDHSNGIIAPGLFGAGIGFPLRVIDPFGNQELNVGLFKFMNDIKRVLPLWQQYDL